MNLQAISPHESTLWWAGWLIPAGECRPYSPELNQTGLKYHLTLTKARAQNRQHYNAANGPAFNVKCHYRWRLKAGRQLARFSTVPFLTSRHHLHFQPVSGQSMLTS